MLICRTRLHCGRVTGRTQTTLSLLESGEGVRNVVASFRPLAIPAPGKAFLVTMICPFAERLYRADCAAVSTPAAVVAPSVLRRAGGNRSQERRATAATQTGCSRCQVTVGG